ncbi:hypothetical protein Cgig2_033913 [Carnegiea gigantea]|uniref:Uncharacterized protein n=1 Tax=Carnegiea gigantea TaxID=171969 RepID=A0A9Q1JFS4_9CARY|nr:hypothetical protein Cgig2_033913 [Carnegiea gigantea]
MKTTLNLSSSGTQRNALILLPLDQAPLVVDVQVSCHHQTMLFRLPEDNLIPDRRRQLHPENRRSVGGNHRCGIFPIYPSSGIETPDAVSVLLVALVEGGVGGVADGSGGVIKGEIKGIVVNSHVLVPVLELEIVVEGVVRGLGLGLGGAGGAEAEPKEEGGKSGGEDEAAAAPAAALFWLRLPPPPNDAVSSCRKLCPENRRSIGGNRRGDIFPIYPWRGIETPDAVGGLLVALAEGGTSGVADGFGGVRKAETKGVVVKSRVVAPVLELMIVVDGVIGGLGLCGIGGFFEGKSVKLVD